MGTIDLAAVLLVELAQAVSTRCRRAIGVASFPLLYTYTIAVPTYGLDAAQARAGPGCSA